MPETTFWTNFSANITAMGGVIVSLLTPILVYILARQNAKITTIAKNVDGLTTKLVATTASDSKAKGVEEGKLIQKAKQKDIDDIKNGNGTAPSL